MASSYTDCLLILPQMEGLSLLPGKLEDYVQTLGNPNLFAHQISPRSRRVGRMHQWNNGTVFLLLPKLRAGQLGPTPTSCWASLQRLPPNDPSFSPTTATSLVLPYTQLFLLTINSMLSVLQATHVWILTSQQACMQIYAPCLHPVFLVLQCLSFTAEART